MGLGGTTGFVSLPLLTGCDVWAEVGEGRAPACSLDSSFALKAETGTLPVSDSIRSLGLTAELHEPRSNKCKIKE